ncbi:MAG: 1-(5-phosphoribosyl)-5-[(5-phosphoribosylamino)methylideneamino]imidazole-4-carboxamide isomerase [Thermodesulfobacteriota bacterium]
MIIIPAIDLKGGRCVRLRQGKMEDETVYSDDPVEVAKRWEAGGAELIHLIDLDGAVGGEPANLGVISGIIRAVNIPVEIGGGIRGTKTAEIYLDMPEVKRIILGTVAHEAPDFVRELAGRHPGRVAVGIDAKDGMVAVHGWVDVTDECAIDLALKFEDAGVAAIIYTDISKDGMLAGPNVQATLDLASKISIPVIASGGMSSVFDVKAFMEASKEQGVGLEGIVVGKALYSGDIELREAILATNGKD